MTALSQINRKEPILYKRLNLFGFVNRFPFDNWRRKVFESCEDIALPDALRDHAGRNEDSGGQRRGGRYELRAVVISAVTSNKNMF